MTSIVNPVAYYKLVREIARYWGQIQRHYSRSALSLSRPKLKPNLRAIQITKFTDLYEAKVQASAGHKYALLTDVAQFFPTIYTHTIPWALHGKEEAKRHRQKNPQYFGNVLDAHSAGLQDQQTVGLPIGPDTSHVIAEIVAVAVDLAIKAQLGYTPHGLRYVDDYCLFFNSRAEADEALTAISRALTAYELRINANKTKVIEVGGLVAESWKYSVRKLEVSDRISRQRDDLHKYFESLFSLERAFKDESLVKYGLKKIATTIIKRPNWSVFEAYLLKCGHTFPNTMQVITTILATYNRYGYPLDKGAISRFCNSIVKDYAALDGHSEIAWALWLAKEVEVRIDKAAIRAVEASSSSACKLIALDLASSGLARAKPLASHIRQYASSEALYGDSWLVAYEGGRRKWLFNKNDRFIRSDSYFADLLKAGVIFYDERKRCKPVFTLINESLDPSNLFDSDKDIDEYFEFQEEEEEYFDSDKEKDEHSEDAEHESGDSLREFDF